MLTRRRLLAGLALVFTVGTTGSLAGCSARKDTVPALPAPVPYPYGPGAIQVADLHLPASSPSGVRGVVVTIHGGFWSSAYDRTLEEPVVADLLAGGCAVWNLDYRSIGNGGGWPETFEDVAAGLDALLPVCEERDLPADRVVLVGHSAGGHLALWGAARHQLPAGAPGAPGPEPTLRVSAVVSQAGVNDLVSAHRDHLGGDAVAALLEVQAGTDLRDDPEGRYRATSPAELLPSGVPTLLVTGDADGNVPASQSREYAERAGAAGDDVDLVVVAGEGHFEHLDPESEVWARTRSWLDDRLRS